MELDMTKGKPISLIMKFIVPVVFGCIFQQFYNTVDTIIVGRFVGVGALAAVGSTGTIMFLILGFVSGLTTGFTVLTAQRYGAGDEKGLKRSVGNAVLLSVIVSIVVTFFSIVFMKPLLRIMHTPSDIFEQAYDYVIVICAGMVCTVAYNISASILRAIGNSKAPLWFLIVSVVVNFVLDLVFIITFKMGVAGAAYATIAAQGISGLFCLIYIWKKVPILHLEREHFRLCGDDTRVQLGIGLPMALQFSITAIGAILVQVALNMLGSVAVAAYTAAIKIEQVLEQPLFAMGTTMATYSAQNMGVGDLKRIREGTKVSALLTYAYALIAGATAILTIRHAIVLFVSGEDAALITDYAVTYIRVVSPFFIPLGTIFVYRNVLQGAGYAFTPMFAGVVELVARTVVAFVAAHFMSFIGISLANVAAWVTAGVYLWAAYEIMIRRAEKKKEALAAADAQALH